MVSFAKIKQKFTQGEKIKTKILSLAVIAGVFTGCSQLNPQAQMGINYELIKDIKTDGKGGYYVTKNEDCDKLMQAGVIKKIRTRDGISSKNIYYYECICVVYYNVIKNAIEIELEFAIELELDAFKMPNLKYLKLKRRQNEHD